MVMNNDTVRFEFALYMLWILLELLCSMCFVVLCFLYHYLSDINALTSQQKCGRGGPLIASDRYKLHLAWSECRW